MSEVRAIAWIAVASMGGLLWSGCGVQELTGCVSDAECRVGRSCVRGQCADAPVTSPWQDLGGADLGSADLGGADLGGEADMSQACPASAPTRCGDVCVNTDTDPSRCGACYTACADGWTCAGGSCAPPRDRCTLGSCRGMTWCNPATQQCEPGCERDSQCDGDQRCDAAHVCVCPSGTQACATGCCTIQERCIAGVLTAWTDQASPHRETLSAETRAQITLDASFSREPAQIEWLLTARPTSSRASLLRAVGRRALLRPDAEGVYEVEVRARDGQGQQTCQPMRMRITASASTPATNALELRLTWVSSDAQGAGSADVALSLRYVRPGAVSWMAPPDAITDANPSADWGVLGDSSDDPHLYTDSTTGAIGIIHPRVSTPGSYAVGVDVQGALGLGEGHATLKVYRHGQLAGSFRSEALTPGDFWYPLIIEQQGTILRPRAGETITRWMLPPLP